MSTLPKLKRHIQEISKQVALQETDSNRNVKALAARHVELRALENDVIMILVSPLPQAHLQSP
jgi:hypothetical protein